MLISKVPDEDGGKGERPAPPVDGDSHEYQTANELFEMMARNQNINSTDGDALTPGDLVLLYKNIDIGTKLMSDANETTHKKPNQHVETVVYNDDAESEGSDVSEICSNEDLQNLYLVNKERLDLFNIPSTANNKLCHKLGGLEIQTPDSISYDKHFLFQDPYIKDQLKAFNLSNSKEVEASLLPASLLDYVCCKRLEDNYNFYMDNIIRYVMNTIEQLKRISNGDYLTERAKEKWREVEHQHIEESTSLANTKVLATSTSIPLHVECKAGGKKSTWDDIVHSEVDVRSLSKILEKKIVVEVPKFISGSYKLLSKCCADNLIIRCKKEQSVEESENESRVDVVFQLKRSETGHVVSNISSIMILQTAPNVKGLTDVKLTEGPRSLLYNEISEENNDSVESKVKIVELGGASKQDDKVEAISNIEDEDNSHCVQKEEENTLQTNINNPNDYKLQNTSNTNIPCNVIQKDDDEISDVYSNSNSCPPKESRRTVTFTTAAKMMDSDATDNTYTDNSEDPLDLSPSETPVDLGMSIHRLSLQGAVPEESLEDVTQSPRLKKKAVRIKSPYENKSFAMEEKKRRKLLEVRERREKKKMAMAENAKVNKNKYAKGTPMPQPSSSVTKLSITNKSFYNSIYGHNADADPKQMKNKNRKGDVHKQVPGVDLEGIENEETSINPSRDANNKKFINRSYYLDDTETEMAVMKQKEDDKDICSGSTSCVSGEFRSNLNLLSQLIVPSDSEGNAENEETDEKYCSDKTSESLITAEIAQNVNNEIPTKISPLSQNTHNIVVQNSPKDTNELDVSKEFKKIKPSIECRKSIDKIYQLMNNMEKRQEPDCKSQNKQSPNTSKESDATGDKGSVSIQGSDSGTSLKHHISSSNPSTFSFSKTNAETSVASKTSDAQTNIISKVIISSKPPNVASKTDVEKHKKDRKVSPIPKVPENHPLKAISQLLHEFENVQKNRLKSAAEQKLAKRSDNGNPVSNEGRTGAPRQSSSKRRSRYEQLDDLDRFGRPTIPKDKRARHAAGIDAPKFSYQQVPFDDKFVEKHNKKKLVDMSDDIREARGEAVRGPSKFNSRLNSLAQPKRAYVQAHSQEYQNRYGRNLITDRLQRLAAAPTPPTVDRTAGSPNYRNRMRRNNNDVVSAVSLKLPAHSNSPIERAAGTRPRHSTNNSPVRRERTHSATGPPHKKTDVFDAPEILVEKMVDVETYVKSHFGPAPCSTTPNLPPPPQKSRVPPVPKNIDAESFSSSPWFQESTEVGSKLHRLINDIIKNSTGYLEVLAESNEHSGPTKDDEDILADSDFDTGTTDNDFLEPVKDPVEIVPEEIHEQINKIDSEQINRTDSNNKINEDEPLVSTKESEDTNRAVCRTLSLGAFSRSLSIKNLKLTQRTSSQHLFLLQAGDTGSIMLNASIHSLKACRKAQREKILDLKALPIPSNSNFPWGLSNIPLHVPSVNYAFPEYSSRQCISPSLSQLLEVSNCSEKISKVSHNSVERIHLCNTTIGNSDSKYHAKHPAGDQLLLDQTLQTGVPVVKTPQSLVLCNSLTPNRLTPVITRDKAHNSNIEISQNVESNVTIKNNDNLNKLSLVEDKTDCTTVISSEAVDYSTSLDILVGLLNEIKKITKSQTHITQSEADDFKQLEIILNKADKMDNSNESVTYKGLSLSKLDKLRCLESNPSVYSYYLSDTEELGRDFYDPWYDMKHQPICADKEISVNIPRKEYVHRLTDVPSMFFPMTINHSTDGTSTLLAELCQTSTQSLVSYHTTSSPPSATIIELPQVIDTKELPAPVKCCEFLEVSPQEVKVKESKFRKPKPANDRRNEIIKKKAKTPNKQIVNNSKKTDFDSIMKIKRDVLVTIYSMLVITVFAALSFPEVLYHM